MSSCGYGVTAYRRAKLAMVMAATDLADELRSTGVTANALHPATRMDTTMVTASGTEPRSTLDKGVTAAMRLALDPTLETSPAGSSTAPARPRRPRTRRRTTSRCARRSAGTATT